MVGKIVLISILLGLFPLTGYSFQKEIIITVENVSSSCFKDEMVEIPLETLWKEKEVRNEPFLLIDDNNKEMAYQITHDSLLIFQVTLEANSTKKIKLVNGQPTVPETFACGKYYKQRMDDIAWENDKVAFRLYGPAIERTGQQLYGYDIFTKRGADKPVVENRYKMMGNPDVRKEANRLRKMGKKKEAAALEYKNSYHVDHGNGMDCYAVGPTLGAGATALMVDSTLLFPYCYKDYEILDNGPLRFTLKLTFAPKQIGDDRNVVETRIIQLDKGSYLNKTTVKYYGLTGCRDIVAGIVIHSSNPNGYSYCKEKGYVAYTDLTQNPKNNNGEIYIGVLFDTSPKWVGTISHPQKGKGNTAYNGHVVGISKYKSGELFTYYWGNSWSKNGWNEEKWKEYILYKRQYLCDKFNVKID